MMMRLALASLAIMAALTGAAQALECENKPTFKKTYAGTNWVIADCDERTFMAITDKDNPLYPYFFLIQPDIFGYRVRGGAPTKTEPEPPPRTAPRDEKLIDAVATELEKMRGKDVDALLAEVAAANPRKKSPDNPKTDTH
jgi:hypothetical protein